MLFLVLMLFVLIIFPWLLIPLALFVIFNLLLLPFSFTLHSFFSLLTIPGQLWQIATNRRLRINHALEHATINVIEEHFGPQQLMGFAREDGFFIKGPAQPHIIEEAARVGLRRLQRGESHLALHRRCGTSMAAANFLASVVFLGLLLATQQFTLVNVILAMLSANLAGPLLGEWLQRYFTTSADVGDMEIVGVEYRVPGFGFFPLSLGVIPTEFFVRTQFRLYQ